MENVSRQGSGAGSLASPSRKPSHCATLKTVNHFRKGTYILLQHMGDDEIALLSLARRMARSAG
ncbi:MAG: hypothetical protein AB7E60_09775 [Sphingobium sp.]